ncbi:hypothetical protein M0802_000784 [Mischocyttarus mexicanus]|nr:hypothetical protein M0802_000784 [Mischocyttarus mexicanus]
MYYKLELSSTIERLGGLILNVLQYGAHSTSQALPILICGSGVDTAEEEGRGEEEVPVLSLKTQISEASEEWILTSLYGESPIAVLFYGMGIWPSPSMPHKADMENHLLG